MDQAYAEGAHISERQAGGYQSRRMQFHFKDAWNNTMFYSIDGARLVPLPAVLSCVSLRGGKPPTYTVWTPPR